MPGLPGRGKRPARKKDHPQGNINVESGPGTLEYRTRGTGNNANTRADGTFWRFTYNARYVGVQFSGFDTRSELRGTTSADSFDGFVYANLPLWPNRRLRFVSRPGAYYNDINLKNAVVGDVEPRTWGFRYELEGEFDIIKKPRLILSVYAAGRFEWGYGDAKTGTGGEEHVDGYGWGWETGVRLQFRRLFGARG